MSRFSIFAGKIALGRRPLAGNLFPPPYLKFLKAQWVKGLCCFLITLGVIWQVSYHVNLVYSSTNSLPYRLFLQCKRVKPQRGNYTCLTSPWYGRQIIKKVAGMAGDTLAYDKEGNLWVNALRVGKAWPVAPVKVGKPNKQTKDGRLLTPIKPGVIPAGKVFVVGDHERSFDSRYAELGLVPEGDLQGRLLALA